ncbi:L,D-transpeptidase family protein [[Clostridium] polysaccharolyticum]|uniref:Putative peptidoglycan binding domain-containing protein n=1 Tax=[Clostridium] polysaccharolyticum TaxID=29364 RepID=A0A1I0C621_9FIRM|nr:peptidoglycan binding domain-containing protein [[Clostridium] polysaccharolyticum]SET14991.1 Putative peptidoglycan binding domain-containing protein [[Clostridium] polysaccharolyticum]
MKRKHKKTVIALTITFLVLLALYIGISFYFKSHFFFGTSINGISASNKCVEAVEENIRREIKNYVLQIDGRNHLTDVITADDIDYEFMPDGSVKQLLKKQKSFTWIVSLFRKNQSDLQVTTTFDDQKLKDKIHSLVFFKKENTTPPADALVKYNDASGKYEIIPENNGTTLDLDKFTSSVITAIESGDTYMNSDDLQCYQNPKYTSSSTELKVLADTMNQYITVTITYDFGDRYEICDKTHIQDWLEVDDSFQVTFNHEKVRAYVDSIARIYNTFGKTRDFIDHNGNIIEVTGGDYGWLIDRAAETARLIKLVQKGKNVQIEPTYSQVARSRNINDIGDSYVEIDLSLQHIWVYKNGKLIVESDCVTGNSSRGFDTPTGIYQITYKEHNATLVGENYSSDVTYWMPFYYNIGLHDAPWRNSFGGSIYKRSGSHGCVNLPPDVAEKVFATVEKGTPIVCYQSNLEEKETVCSNTDSNTKKEKTVASASVHASKKPASTSRNR